MLYTKLERQFEICKPENCFCRIYKNYIVNVNFIQKKRMYVIKKNVCD